MPYTPAGRWRRRVLGKAVLATSTCFSVGAACWQGVGRVGIDFSEQRRACVIWGVIWSRSCLRNPPRHASCRIEQIWRSLQQLCTRELVSSVFTKGCCCSRHILNRVQLKAPWQSVTCTRAVAAGRDGHRQAASFYTEVLHRRQEPRR